MIKVTYIDSMVNEIQKIAEQASKETKAITGTRSQGWLRTVGPYLVGMTAGTLASKKLIPKGSSSLHMAMGGLTGTSSGLLGSASNYMREKRKAGLIKKAGWTSGVKKVETSPYAKLMIDSATSLPFGVGMALADRKLKQEKSPKYTPGMRLAKQDLTARSAATAGAGAIAGYQLLKHLRK